MRIIILAFVLAGCVTKPPPKPYLTLEQLRKYEVTQADCPNIERKIQQLEQQQINAGIARVDPELLPEPDREYQARIRVAVWALRIGCSNPGRYG